VACLFSYRYFFRVVSEEVYRNVHQSGDYIKNNELGGTRASGEDHTVFWWGIFRERNHMEDLDIDGRIILR
jgi:hypothetical protein